MQKIVHVYPSFIFQMLQVNENDQLLDSREYTPLHWACYNGE